MAAPIIGAAPHVSSRAPLIFGIANPPQGPYNAPPMNPRVSFVSLGCAKNLVDSEVLLGRLVRGGFDVCSEYADSDVVVVNTCGFLAAAEKESLDAIRRLVALKGKGRLKAVVVAGCLPQRHGRAFARRLPGVDAVLGTGHRDRIVEVCTTAIRNGCPRPLNLVSTGRAHCEADRRRFRLTPPHTAHLRLSEGCNHTCAFCVIPKIRGRYRSKPMETVLAEARELAAGGARELNLVAQDTTSYGTDLHGRPVLDALLRKLEAVRGVEWIRILYGYPVHANDRLIAEVAQNPKVVKYLDMPVQHTRDRMLRAMRRGVTERSQKEIIRKWREGVPGLVLRTTILTGFPGETEEDFEGLIEDLRELRFERLGTFAYSREPGTRADQMAGHLPEKVKVRRRDRVMLLQQEITFGHQRSLVGKEVAVLVEKKAGKDVWTGRTAGDAPEVDGTITLRGKSAVGDVARACVTGWKGYDLAGELV